MAKFDRQSVTPAVLAGDYWPRIARTNDVFRNRGVGSPPRSRSPATSMMTSVAISGRDAAVIPQQSAEPIDALDTSAGCANLVARRDNSVTDLRRSGANPGRDARARQLRPTAMTSVCKIAVDIAARANGERDSADHATRAAPGNRRVGARRTTFARLRPSSGHKPRLLRL